VEIRLLGDVQLWTGGRAVHLGPRQRQLVFAVLALEVNRVLPLANLVDLVWARRPPRTAQHAVEVHVSDLRGRIAAGGAQACLERRGAGYRLCADPQTVDVHRFRALLADAREQTSDTDRADLLRRALRLWHGPALTGVVEDSLRERLVANLEEARLQAVEDHAAALVRLRRHGEVVEDLLPLVAEHPLREHLAAQLALGLHGIGQTVRALQLLRDTRRRLMDEFGVDPGMVLRRVETQILQLNAEPIAS
jgi:ABC-2 type transport system ATP-binding protein